jgi:hypothetical protein
MFCGAGIWLEVTQDPAHLEALDSVAFCYQNVRSHTCISVAILILFLRHSALFFMILRFCISSTPFLFLCSFLPIIRYLPYFLELCFHHISVPLTAVSISQTFPLILRSLLCAYTQAGDSLSPHSLADINVTWYPQCCCLVFHKQTIDIQQYVQNVLQMYPLTAPGLKSPVSFNAIILRLCSSNIVVISCLYCGSYANVTLMLL